MATPIPVNRCSFSIEEIVKATKGKRVGGGSDDADSVTIRGITIDSRQVEPGNLFFAIPGDKHDGHDFLGAAVSQGAKAVVVQKGRGTGVAAPCITIEVTDTVRALGDLARAHRKRWGKSVVGITGSVGKTTTKELTAVAVGSLGARVHKTEGNLNNTIGVPMTLFGLTDSVDVAIVEMGTSKPGEIERLATIAEPDMALVTTAAAAHSEGLGSLDSIVKEKGSLYESLGKKGIAIINVDDERLSAFAEKELPAAQKRFTFGTKEGADVQLVSRGFDPMLRAQCVFEVKGDIKAASSLRFLSEAAAIDAAAALTVVLAMGGPHSVPRAALALERVDPPTGRFSLVETKRGLIIDDTYNASPRSVQEAMRSAREIATERGGRLVFILGDMKELGELSESAHQEVGRFVAEIGADIFLACGSEMRAAADVARKLTKRKDAPSSTLVEWIDSASDAAGHLPETDRSDVILIKGSRSMRMERVVDQLRGVPAG